MSSKVEKSRLVISSKKEEEWLRRMRESTKDMFDRLIGQLLTTMEIPLPDGSQLEALRSRIKDVRGEVWDRIDQAEYRIYSDYFSVSDESQDTKPSEKEYAETVKEFSRQMQEMLDANFGRFREVVANLVVLVVEDTQRQQALKIEIERLMKNASFTLNRWLCRGIEEVFLEVK